MRHRGKSDLIDAESAARKVLSGEAAATPKTQDGDVEKIRILRLTRRSTVVAQGQASNQVHALIATVPDELRDRLCALTTRKAGRHGGPVASRPAGRLGDHDLSSTRRSSPDPEWMATVRHGVVEKR